MSGKRGSAGARISSVQRFMFLVVACALWMAPIACVQQYTRPGGGFSALPSAIAAMPTPVSQGAPTPAPTGEPPAVLPAATLEQPADTATQPPAPTETPTTTPTTNTTPLPPLLYYTQAGDTLQSLAARFNVLPEEITSPEPIPQEGLFNPNVLLLIPQRLDVVSSDIRLIPDSEIVYSPSALDLDLKAYIQQAGGYLWTHYREYRSTGWHDGVQTIQRVSVENSINPRMLLAILEQQSHWVYGQPENLAQTDYPVGYLSNVVEKASLYSQLSWAVQQLNIGYYGWRDGRITELTFPDRSTLRLAPQLNAGTVALLYLFAQLYNQEDWAGVIYGPDGIVQLYERMYGNPWLRAQAVEPLFPATLTQPPLELPFTAGHTWSFTGGPHSAWGPDGAMAALDFAPSSVEHGCVNSPEWAAAAASGLVVRSGNGVVVLDLDGDGYEQTGWALLYLHVASAGRVPVGTWVNTGEPVGHPSCEGGFSSGTHIHIARKYNGEWILADGPMPFVLSGWRAHAEPGFYKGRLTKGDQVVYSSLVGSHESLVTRPRESNP